MFKLRKKQNQILCISSQSIGQRNPFLFLQVHYKEFANCLVQIIHVLSYTLLKCASFPNYVTNTQEKRWFHLLDGARRRELAERSGFDLTTSFFMTVFMTLTFSGILTGFFTIFWTILGSWSWSILHKYSSWMAQILFLIVLYIT